MEFLSKKTGNMTKLVTTNMPKGRRRKGGVAPRSRKPSQPAKTRAEMSVPHTDPAGTATLVPTPQPVMMPPTPSFPACLGATASRDGAPKHGSDVYG